MPRIPESVLARLKSDISLERLVAASGIELKRQGADLHGRCPFHDDKTPSLVISPKENLWHCLGACQTGGSTIDWVMKREGVSFREAAERLRAEHPSLAAAPQAPARAARKAPEASLDDAARLGWVADFYHQTLRRCPEAMAYLQARGLDDAEAIDTFHLGYANRTLGYELPHSRLKAGKEQRSQLQRLGVMRKSGHEHLNGSLVIPLFDDGGEVVQLYGRKLRDDLRQGTAKHLYLPGPQRGVFNGAAVAEHSHVIVCESLIDALSFWCAGLRNVTACFGVSGFTAELQQALAAPRITRITIAFDRDEAGIAGAKKLGAKLLKLGKAVHVAAFPHGHDANGFAASLPADERGRALQQLVQGAEWLGNGKGPSVPKPVRDNAAPQAPEALPPAGSNVAAPSLAAVAPATSTREQLREEACGVISSSSQLGAQASDDARSTAASSDDASADDATADEVTFQHGDRRWRVRGLSRNDKPEALRVNLFVSRSAASREGGGFHVDTIELYNARHRSGFIKQAAEELGCEERVIKRDLGRVLLALEQQQEQARTAEQTPKTRVPELTNADKLAAMELLRDPRLLDRILEDFEACGVVGEETNKLIGYLAAVSRKLDEPLAIVIQSSSAAGKSSLMEAILAMVPEEERVQYSAMTGQSLFYMSEQDLKHRILAIAEEEGAERASYALKLLQSEGQLTIASTGKDPQSGRHVTQEYRVEGPVMIMLTTTAIDIDEELLNRCIVLTVDEGEPQTERIHEAQRRAQTLAGMLSRHDRQAVRKLHQNAQRLLRPVMVVNPFAEQLTFETRVTRTRRDHAKYLTLIRTIALLHQYQRPRKSLQHRGQQLQYIEVTEQDVHVADRIRVDVLQRGLDELPPQTRKLLGDIGKLVRERSHVFGLEEMDVRFTQRDVREHSGLGNTQVKVHLQRLAELEYVYLHGGGPRRRMVYELAGCGYDPNWSDRLTNWSGTTTNWSGPGRPLVGGGVRPVNGNDADSLQALVGFGGNHFSGEEMDEEVVPSISGGLPQSPLDAAVPG